MKPFAPNSRRAISFEKFRGCQKIVNVTLRGSKRFDTLWEIMQSIETSDLTIGFGPLPKLFKSTPATSRAPEGDHHRGRTVRGLAILGAAQEFPERGYAN
jgi:hypothetical protein